MVSPQPDHLVLSLASPHSPNAERVDVAHRDPPLTLIPQTLIQELWLSSGAEACDLTLDEFARSLVSVGARFNFGQPSATHPEAAQRAEFLRSLRLADLALATACALGRDAAWSRFLNLYRAPLTQAAIAISRSATVGNDLADSLYAELYGLRGAQVERRSPLASYSGRGSLLGWLRTTLAQRHVDHHRRTHRETPLDTLDVPSPEPVVAPLSAHLLCLKSAVTRTLQALVPEDRFLLAAYFLDQRTLLEISRILHVHEATVSRRLKRLSASLREQILHHLQASGLSARAAKEAIGIDPRDLEINLRWLLQSSQTSPFPVESMNQASPDGEQKPAEFNQS